MARFAILVYGVLGYVVFVATLLYGVGFVSGLAVPKDIDSGEADGWGRALLVDLALLAVFAAPHSVMARPGFKRVWTRFVPPPAERSTYVLVSSLLLALLFWQWRPLPGVVWEVTHPVVWAVLEGLSLAGWGVVVWSSFLTDHFDLFGLRQVYLHWRGKPYTPPEFTVRSLYRFVRHPLMIGFLVAFWAAPRMTTGHLLFAAATTAYILVALRLEERDLVRAHGEAYRRYQREVGMLLPFVPPRTASRAEAERR